ncbi:MULTISPECIES: sarcosine oxidase subunit gamma [Pacificibacter]|uniref:sarcosine oxidase subunit gamma n=1 Tax=Pacificibacter TaxID=1042323 RepID=UPI001C0876B8|nr:MULTISPECIES: sarcosine oxidase subunit gamma [Pacificibacter]MBU2937180.1 sarcosine oxidase subunit gamma [Pacificibacter marinus]MDO6617001.1 sarcosine oxidase subunit gamma [Pacificibacter sp. 1_MG-2023]
MTDLTPITALGASAPRSQDFGAYTLRENSALALVSLAIARCATPPTPFGLTLPSAGCCTTHADYTAFWTSPDQWMITAENLGETDFAATVQNEVPDARLTEQTDGWVAFDITAETDGQIGAVLSRVANLPLIDLTPGKAVRTGFDHMSIFLVRRSERHVTVIVMRTLAVTLWHALETILQRLGDTK